MHNCKNSGQRGLTFEMIGPCAHEILKSRSCKSLCSNLPISQLVIKRQQDYCLFFLRKDGQMVYLGAGWSSCCRLQLALGLCVAQQYLQGQHFFLLSVVLPFSCFWTVAYSIFFTSIFLGCSCVAFVSCPCHFWRRESALLNLGSGLFSPLSIYLIAWDSRHCKPHCKTI